MPMSNTEPMASREEIVSSLKQRASELWGEERALALLPVVEQTAGVIWQISQDPPPADEEPGFYF